MKVALESKRIIRSYVRREGRITERQRRALAQLWPRYGLEFTSDIFSFKDIFQRDVYRVLEIGFGNGEALLQNTAKHPDYDFMGIEVYRPGVGALLANLCEANINNVKLITHDASEVLAKCIPVNSLDLVQLFFPDPWPKKRHHKRRLVQAEFLSKLLKVLKPEGLFHVATDWQPYAEHVMEQLAACDALKVMPYDTIPEVITAMRPNTKFARRGQRLGHSITDLIFKKL
ncbi:MAG: tRNA (guanosine(46)-N7)-methyltransferase TrmB [Gammaproteobacteria bacterium]|nr:tRNA (guanosine(46)-N7)-methyltransferase TrmB [Gammaproteobacteria bacterium]